MTQDDHSQGTFVTPLIYKQEVGLFEQWAMQYGLGLDKTPWGMYLELQTLVAWDAWWAALKVQRG